MNTLSPKIQSWRVGEDRGEVHLIRSPANIDRGGLGGQYDMERVFANLFRHLWVRRLARGASSSNWELGRRSRRVPRVRALSVTPPFHRSVQACQARSVSAQVSPVRPGRVLLGSVRPE